jgi:hypothetical protein
MGENFIEAPVVGAAMSSLRIRTDIELYVSAQATGTNPISSLLWEETLIVMGTEIFPSTAGEAISDLPLTNPVPGGPSLGWVQWEYLYPELMNLDLNTPEVATVVWRPRGGTVDTQARRAVGVGKGLHVWLAWEIQDGAGLINTTTAGVTYSLGARFAQQLWYETKS